MKNRLMAIGWAFSIAWKVNKAILIVWFSLISLVSVLPSIALYYNREIINQMDRFVLTGTGAFADVLPTIIVFGIITALVGLSNRLNVELIYSLMYNKYYFGMAELLMDSVQNFSMEELLQKDVKDEYYAVVLREGSLTDVISGLCSLVGKFVSLGSLLIVAFSLSMPVFLFSFIYILSVIGLNLLSTKTRRNALKKISENQRLAWHYEAIPYSAEYAKEMRVFETKKRLLQSWETAYQPIYEYQVKDALGIEARTFISGFGFYIFLSLMIIYSLYSVVNGFMEAASLLIIFTMCMNIFSSVSNVARMLMLTDHGIYAIERQYRIFVGHEKKNEIKNEPVPAMAGNEFVFEAKNLSYAYGGDKLALKNVSLAIKKGETIALVGENGSGKSTLVNLLLQLYQPLSGNLYFNGIDYKDLEPGFLKNKIGAFFQDYYFFHMPIDENIGFGDIDHVSDGKRIDAALEKGGATALVDRLPKGKATFIRKEIEKEGAEFSGGELQKLAISRTHMSDKDILIFDEPASALDPVAELEQFMCIKNKIEGHTAILISHRVGFASLADRIIFMDHGEVAEVGTHDELMQKKGLYADFFHAQAKWYQNVEE